MLIDYFKGSAYNYFNTLLHLNLNHLLSTTYKLVDSRANFILNNPPLTPPKPFFYGNNQNFVETVTTN